MATETTAPQEGTAPEKPVITCYVMATKQKGVAMQDPVISITARGGYMASGHDGQGNKCVSMMSKAKAIEAIDAGVAKWAEGAQN